MCGKGTTLYEGFIRGFDVKGIEINEQWTQEIQTYVVRFLKEGKFKHKVEKSKVSDSKKKKIANVFNLTAAAEKNALIQEMFNHSSYLIQILEKQIFLLRKIL